MRGLVAAVLLCFVAVVDAVYVTLLMLLFVRAIPVAAVVENANMRICPAGGFSHFYPTSHPQALV